LGWLDTRFFRLFTNGEVRQSNFAQTAVLKETTAMLFTAFTLRLGLVAGVVLLATGSAMAQTGAEPSPGPPDELFAPEGTLITVQISEYLSSDKNSTGDTFIGALRQPLVIDGWVVARAGQTVFGQVSSANKAGRVRGTSDLALELTEIVLVDGHQAGIRTQLLVHRGSESRGEDAATIVTTTAVGAIIGAAIGDARGALIGAGIGAAGGTTGVLSTRGKPAEVHPENTLTFRLDTPLIVSTVRSSRAFQSVTAEDYPSEPTIRKEPRPRSIEYRSYPRFPRYPGPPVGVIVIP
jgi:hypothetical protein